MGWDFWQDAKQYEDKISKELDIGKHTTRLFAAHLEISHKARRNRTRRIFINSLSPRFGPSPTIPIQSSSRRDSHQEAAPSEYV